MSTATPGRAQTPDSLASDAALVDAHLQQFVSSLELADNLRDAIRYALLGGGKRLRPALALECCAAVGTPREQALPAAAAVELIHAFSLAHDDLPAMDDDDLRRGRPTLHKAYGEAMAILAGDAMTVLAFRAVCDNSVNPALAGVLCRELADASAAMIVGQVYDTLGGMPESLAPADRVALIHRCKTGALLLASCRMGALMGFASPAAAANDPRLASLTTYGAAIGLMYQVVDDLLDVEQTTENTGKRTGKDAEAGKLTFPGVLGVEGSRNEVKRLRGLAHDALAPLGPLGSELARICDFLAVRTS
ncbi:MAG: polyprenyl synthetase family protein [Phycisphaerales bacterium]